jgi:hypothetical protein
MKKIFVALVLIAGLSASAQIKIGTNPTQLNLGSILELESDSKGLRFPQVILTSTLDWAPLLGTQVKGMTVYNTNTTVTGTNDVTPGLYTNNGAVWVKNETAGFQVQKSRLHTDNTAIIWETTDYSVVTTSLGTISLVSLPDATTLPENSVRCVSNNGSGNAGWDASALVGKFRPVGNYPATISPGTGFCFVTIAKKWYILSGR